MYQGYRIKIENDIFPNTFIARGSYSISSEKRIAETYTDSYLIDHVITTGENKITISFRIKSHGLKEHEAIIRLIQKRHNVSIEYWDDNTCYYKMGSFDCGKITFSHINTDKTDIEYAETQVVYTEY